MPMSSKMPSVSHRSRSDLGHMSPNRSELEAGPIKNHTILQFRDARPSFFNGVFKSGHVISTSLAETFKYLPPLLLFFFCRVLATSSTPADFQSAITRRNTKPISTVFGCLSECGPNHVLTHEGKVETPFCACRFPHQNRCTLKVAYNTGIRL